MSALQELQSGQLGPNFVTLLYRQVAVVAITRHIPPPEGYGRWTKDAVTEASHDFLTDKDMYRRLLELLARVHDEDELRRLLSVMVWNHFRAQGRRTAIGRLIRRLKSVLGDDDRFLVVPERQPGAGNVALAGGPSKPYGGPPGALTSAARSEREVTVVRWSPQARRQGPAADAPSLARLALAVLTAAEGSLSFADLAHAMAGRLGIDPRAVPVGVTVDELEDMSRMPHQNAGAASSGEGADALKLENEQVAQAVLAQLTARERLVLAWLHETVRVIADRCGLAVSSAGVLKQRVTDKLRTILSDTDEQSAEAIAVAARDLARREAGLDPV